MNAQFGPATSNRVDIRRLELETTGPVEVAVRDAWGRDMVTRPPDEEAPARSWAGGGCE